MSIQAEELPQYRTSAHVVYVTSTDDRSSIRMWTIGKVAVSDKSKVTKIEWFPGVCVEVQFDDGASLIYPWDQVICIQLGKVAKEGK